MIIFYLIDIVSKGEMLQSLSFMYCVQKAQLLLDYSLSVRSHYIHVRSHQTFHDDRVRIACLFVSSQMVICLR